MTKAEDLNWTIEEFCDDHASSKADGNADYALDAETFRNWCDATGHESYKSDVPDNATLRWLIAGSAFPELANEVPV